MSCPAFQQQYPLEAGQPLVYTVRFQNTGTYPASFVVIRDTLSSNLDPASLQLLGASHPLTWSMRGNGIVEFRFDGINLPAMNADEPGSHGFVQFSVKPKANQALGAITENTAFIYFDFNDPIITNTVSTTVVSILEPINVLKLMVQPNPASTSLRVQWPEGQIPQGLTLFLHDAAGRLIQTIPVDNQELSIDVRALKAGTYFLSGHDGKQHFSGVFEVLR